MREPLASERRRPIVMVGLLVAHAETFADLERRFAIVAPKEVLG